MSVWAQCLVWLATFAVVYWATSKGLDGYERWHKRRHVLDDVARRDAAREAMRRWHSKD